MALGGGDDVDPSAQRQHGLLGGLLPRLRGGRERLHQHPRTGPVEGLLQLGRRGPFRPRRDGSAVGEQDLCGADAYRREPRPYAVVAREPLTPGQQSLGVGTADGTVARQHDGRIAFGMW
ncbi:hypothetical protein [Kitasatospora aureofaciens]|uniref:hypothetical protein n=1 Tax=Kitasatospora aureofaciens TaxID=1894 RepID=UPI001F1C268A|nr:hypothetical protein [Kitasatospora aureofaciens]